MDAVKDAYSFAILSRSSSRQSPSGAGAGAPRQAQFITILQQCEGGAYSLIPFAEQHHQTRTT
jgi:hypothetical protein